MGLTRLVVGISDMLTRAVQAVVVVLASVMLVSISLQIVMRYVFNKPLTWTEELALLTFSWTMLLMLAMGVRQAFHVRMDIVADRLPAALQLALERLIALLVAGFGAYLAKAGATYVLETTGSVSAAIGYPIYALYSVAPVCGVLICWFALERLILGPAPKEVIA